MYRQQDVVPKGLGAQFQLEITTYSPVEAMNQYKPGDAVVVCLNAWQYLTVTTSGMWAAPLGMSLLAKTRMG